MDSFERIQQLRDEYESSLDEAERLRDEYHREIVKLHRSGMSLREIADGLGISHQRVHQIVSPHEEQPATPNKGKRGLVAGAAVAALILAVAAGALIERGGTHDTSDVAVPAGLLNAAGCRPPAAPADPAGARPSCTAAIRKIASASLPGVSWTEKVCSPRVDIHTGSGAKSKTQPVELCQRIVAVNPKNGKIVGSASSSDVAAGMLAGSLAPPPPQTQLVTPGP